MAEGAGNGATSKVIGLGVPDRKLQLKRIGYLSMVEMNRLN
jgi:hypothetical protein